MPNYKATQHSLDLGYTAMLCVDRKFAHHQTGTRSEKYLSRSALSNFSHRSTHRKHHKENILNNPHARHRPNPQRSPPRIPIMTLCRALKPPAAKTPIQMELPITLPTSTNPRLKIPQPITCNINKRRNSATHHARGHQNNPHLARIRQLLDMPQHAGRTRVQIPQPLPLLGVFEDPVDGCKVIVADAAPGPFDVPVQAIRVFSVVEAFACVAGRVEVVEDELGGVVGGACAGAEMRETGIWRSWERGSASACGGGGEEAREAEGGCRGFGFALERYSEDMSAIFVS
jgi:hypothetical protein